MENQTILDEKDAQTSETTEKKTQSDDNADYKSLYLSEIDNAKKLRKRAQAVEEENKSLKTQFETEAEKRMRKNEEYKELSESLTAKLDKANYVVEKWNKYETVRRDQLISKVSEEDRERVSKMDLDTIEYVVSKIEDAKASNISHKPGDIRKTLPEGNIYAQTPEKRKEFWNDYVNDKIVR